MKSAMRIVLLVVLSLSLVSIPLGAQQAPAQTPPPSEQSVLILFIGQVNEGSVPRLMALITTEINQGVGNIIVGISSDGGNSSMAFGAYNSLTALERQHPKTKITTVNIGSVASAAVIIFCAGTERYSLPNATFLIHGNGMDVPPSHLEASTLKNSLDLVNAMNAQTIEIISSTTKKNKAEIEAAVAGQIVLSAQQAKEWNLVQEIKALPAPPDAPVLTVSVQPDQTQSPIQVSSISKVE